MTEIALSVLAARDQISNAGLKMKCIEHCATAKAYGRFREAGVMTKMNDVAAGIAKSKEEKDNVEKGFN